MTSDLKRTKVSANCVFIYIWTTLFNIFIIKIIVKLIEKLGVYSMIEALRQFVNAARHHQLRLRIVQIHHAARHSTASLHKRTPFTTTSAASIASFILHFYRHC
jgi:hypothetical protein